MTKVLVFESDPSFAGELLTKLGRIGCTVQVVDDGTRGLQVAAADRPDLILLSIELPRMNGFSVCNKLKKDAHLNGVPLVIMSGESSEETFEQHRKLRTHADDYVHKPIAFGDLLEHIRAFVTLDEHREGDLDGAEAPTPEPGELAARRRRATTVLEEITEARAKRKAAGLRDHGQHEHGAERLAKDVLAMAAEIDSLTGELQAIKEKMKQILILAKV